MNTPWKRVEHRTPSRAFLFCVDSGNRLFVALDRTGDRVSYYGSLESWSAHVVLSTFAGCNHERVLP